nr:MAG TPA: hypothetical protein [Bacteriophage sp.]DAZ50108.1 MAG TPA: hypothetical protein [Caudoviricetes sp.]
MTLSLRGWLCRRSWNTSRAATGSASLTRAYWIRSISRS